MGLFDIFRRKKEEAKQEDALVEVQQQEELSQGLEKTKQGFFSKLARAVAGRDKVDDVVLDQLEEVLITSDVGVETTVRIIERIEERVARDKYMNTAELQGILRGEIAALLQESAESQDNFGLPMREGEPYVVMVVGVNGAGKTTTIGKLAAQLVRAGKKVYIGTGTTMFGHAGLEIGDHTLLAQNITVTPYSHIFDDPEATIISQGGCVEKVTIGRDCYLGMGVCVMYSGSIGDGSVVGAHSTVIKAIPPYSVAVGTPARVIKKREKAEQ